MSLIEILASWLLVPRDKTLTIDPNPGGYTVRDDSLPAGPQSIVVTPKVNTPGIRATPYQGHDYTDGGR